MARGGNAASYGFALEQIFSFVLIIEGVLQGIVTRFDKAKVLGVVGAHNISFDIYGSANSADLHYHQSPVDIDPVDCCLWRPQKPD